MNLIYQGVPGAYSNIACLEAKKGLNVDIENIEGLVDFKSVWETIDDNNIAVLPVENSYAGNIHENIYGFLRYDYKIIGEINLAVNHSLLSREENIEDIKEVYSHPQALDQCHNFLKQRNIKPIAYGDTAGAAEMLDRKKLSGAGVIASSLAGEIYSLNNIQTHIQDQEGNTTRFFVIAPKDSDIEFKPLSSKISIIFEAKNIPASLYKCLGAFADNSVNLTKIESMPSLKGPFSYLFWITCEGGLGDENIKKSLEELKKFTNVIRILGEY